MLRVRTVAQKANINSATSPRSPLRHNLRTSSGSITKIHIT